MYKTGIHTTFQENWLNYGVGGLQTEDRKGLKFYKEYILKSLLLQTDWLVQVDWVCTC